MNVVVDISWTGGNSVTRLMWWWGLPPREFKASFSTSNRTSNPNRVCIPILTRDERLGCQLNMGDFPSSARSRPATCFGQRIDWFWTNKKTIKKNHKTRKCTDPVPAALLLHPSSNLKTAPMKVRCRSFSNSTIAYDGRSPRSGMLSSTTTRHSITPSGVWSFNGEERLGFISPCHSHPKYEGSTLFNDHRWMVWTL